MCVGSRRDPWKDVAWCVWISSRSCDLSQAFLHFDLYNMIRLGVTDRSSAATDRSSAAADRSSPAADRSSAATDRSSAATDRSSAATVWGEPVKFDYSDFGRSVRGAAGQRAQIVSVASRF